MAHGRRFALAVLTICLIFIPAAAGGAGGDAGSVSPIGGREKARPDEELPLVVLDPGHGGEDKGTVGPSGLTEAEVAWDVASGLKQALERERVARVLLARSKEANPSLAERTALANGSGAALFVGIHAGAAFRQGAKGASAFVASPPGKTGEVALNGGTRKLFRPTRRRGRRTRSAPVRWEATQEPHRAASWRACATILEALTGGGKVEAGGLHEADLPQLQGAAMPACIIELATLTNPAEEAALRQDSTRQALVMALFKGIKRELEGSP